MWAKLLRLTGSEVCWAVQPEIQGAILLRRKNLWSFSFRELLLPNKCLLLPSFEIIYERLRFCLWQELFNNQYQTLGKTHWQLRLRVWSFKVLWQHVGVLHCLLDFLSVLYCCGWSRVLICPDPMWTEGLRSYIVCETQSSAWALPSLFPPGPWFLSCVLQMVSISSVLFKSLGSPSYIPQILCCWKPCVSQMSNSWRMTHFHVQEMVSDTSNCDFIALGQQNLPRVK